MLRYVLHARNADEHGVSKVTEVKQGGIGINVGGDGVVEHMEISVDPKRVDIKYTGKNPLHFNFIPAKLNLISVFDRSVRYDPPKTHLGRAIEATPLEVARLTTQYLQSVIDEAEKKFPFE